MRQLLVLLLVTALSGLPLVQASAQQKHKAGSDAGFLAFNEDLANTIAHDKHWKRIPIDTASQQAAFAEQLHALYSGRISDIDFLTFMNLNYKGHDYEKEMLVNYTRIYKETH